MLIVIIYLLLVRSQLFLKKDSDAVRTGTQLPTISGYVLDIESGELLSGVKLSIQDWKGDDGLTLETTSDQFGRYQFLNLHKPTKPLQQVRLVASKAGYVSSSTDPVIGVISHPIALQPREEGNRQP